MEGDSVEAWAACGLLRWALTGTVPARYHPCASSKPLLAASDVNHFATVVQNLQAGLMGGELTGFGQALAGLITPVTHVR